MDRPHVAASVCVNSRSQKNCEHFVSVTRKSSEAIRQIFTKKSVTHTVPAVSAVRGARTQKIRLEHLNKGFGYVTSIV